MSDIDQYPIGTKFKILAKLTDREGGIDYLYANPRDPVVVINAREVASFLAGLKQDRSGHA